LFGKGKGERQQLKRVGNWASKKSDVRHAMFKGFEGNFEENVFGRSYSLPVNAGYNYFKF
jgi:hypothetical protein